MSTTLFVLLGILLPKFMTARVIVAGAKAAAAVAMSETSTSLEVT
jgi:hypothetical protein